MRIKIAYGKKGLYIDVPDENLYKVAEPEFVPGVDDAYQAIVESVKNPIASRPLPDLVEPGTKTTIVVSDKTRPVPSHLLVPAILSELNATGVEDEDITILVATGLHRPNTKDELEEMLGAAVLNRVEVVNHDARNKESQVYLGDTNNGTPIWIDKVLHKAEFRILTGYIEPHFFAGFTGGRKAILPGCAGKDSIAVNHGADHIGHPKARTGISKGNPIYEDGVEAAEKVGVDFIVNVTLNREKEITRVFSGDVVEAHRKGTEFVSQKSKIPIEEKVDIAITNNSGYPLDLNLYQAVKGMTTPENVIKEGGEIIMAAECSDGIGHQTFENMILEAGSPERFLEQVHSPDFFVIDQWQTQILARILSKAQISLFSENIDDQKARGMWLKPIDSVEQGIRNAIDRLGEDAKILVLPDGPETWPVYSP